MKLEVEFCFNPCYNGSGVRSRLEKAGELLKIGFQSLL